jgi:uncharacterized membrane protein YuzA (DUF378 family)
MATWILVIVGALNWGLVGLFNMNLVATLFGMGSMLEKLVYVLVGASAVYEAATHMKNCKLCGSK